MILVYDVQVPAAESDAYEYRDRATLHATPWVDGLQPRGNQFDCFSTLQGNTTAVMIVKSDPDGRELGRWTLPALANFKIDDFGVFQNGPDLILLVAAHEISSATDRRNIVYRDQLTGVAVPYAAGAMPVGNDTRWIGEQEPQPPIDVAAIADAVLARLERALGRPLRDALRKEAENGAAVAIREAGVLTEQTVYESTGLYNRVKETSYESCKNAIKDSK